MRFGSLLLGAALVATAGPALAQQIVPLGNRDVPLAGQPRDVFRVGENEAREEEQFARIVATAFDADDNLYVLDVENHRVTVFDATGSFVRTIGRKGEGPGELRLPLGLAVTHDGHVVVMDLGNRAMVVYRRDGTYLRNIAIDRSLGMPNRVFAPHPDGGVVFAMNPGVTIQNGMPQIDTSGIKVYRLASFAEGATPTLLLTVSQPKQETRVEGSPAGGVMRVMMGAPPVFTPQLHVALAPDGSLVVSNSDRFDLQVLGADGRVTRRLQRPFTPRKVTDADKKAEVERRRQAIATGGARVMVTGSGGPARQMELSQVELRRMQEETLRNLQFAETVPVVSGMMADPAGRLWVLRSSASPDEPSGPIDIIGTSGRYLGTVRGEALPSSISRSGLAAYIGTSELDVPIVTVRRLPQNRRG